MLSVDYRAVVSRADLIYQSPVEAPAEGQPIGNGVMGTLVWTTPSAIHLQINRNDVFAVNKNHGGNWDGQADYCGGCAQVAVDVGGGAFEAGEPFQQRLSLYEAESTVVGAEVHVRCFVSAVSDVLVLEVDDQRAEPRPVRVTVSMWRVPEVKRGEHVARYEFADLAEEVLVVQQFSEKGYHCASAVGAQRVGGDAQIEASGERSRVIIAPAKQGKRLIVVSSAASWSRKEDVGTKAIELLRDASGCAYDVLRQEHVRWWFEFWSRTFVYLTSEDGVAEFMERVRNLHLYVMASTSRGALPPKWNGSLFTTQGDTRTWGSQFWVWTTEMLYLPMFAADAVHLTEPYFGMYVKQLPACEKASLQRWGVEGAFFPETTPFDGPVVLPDDVAQEVLDVRLGRKRNTELSDRAVALCQFERHLATALCSEEQGAIGRYSWISHIASSGSELAVQGWWRYRYTGDKEWLRRNAYPLLRGTAEFYYHLVKRSDDGRYHVCGTNQHEDFWGTKDGIWDLAAIRGTVPLAICAAELLGVDTELSARWQELLDHLAPYPMGSDPESKALTGGVLANDVWAAGHLGDVDGQHNPEDVWLTPVFPFEDWTLETRNPAVDKIVRRAVELAPRMLSILNGARCNTAIRTPIVWSRAGRGAKLPLIVASYYAAFAPLASGLSLFEGPHACSVEHLGCISVVLQEGLLQSVSPHPGEPEIVSVFPAWPKTWEAAFRLLARGGFLVTSASNNGEVEFVEIESRLGEACRLRNPWDRLCLISEVDGPTQELEGDVLRFDTKPGKHYWVLPKDVPEPTPRHISPRPATEPASYSLTLPNGTTVQGTLGRRR